ncbi:MAG: phospholipase D-like domain-containing protein [Ignavibacteriaceae bacterium]
MKFADKKGESVLIKFLSFILFFIVISYADNLFAQAANHIVISEVAPMGGASTTFNTGEYIELYNPLPNEVVIGGNVVVTSGEANGTNNAAWTLSLSGKTIKAYGFLLIGDGGVLVTPDAMFPVSKNLANSGARSYIQLKDGGVVIDAFGWDPAAVITPNCEGTALQPSNTTSNKKSFERKSGALAVADDTLGNAWDTNNNSSDFFENTSVQANPQNSSSKIEINPYNITSTNGPGTASITPSIWKFDNPTALRFVIKSADTEINGIAIVRPPLFSWNPANIYAEHPTISITQSGDTTFFNNFSLSGTDSVVIEIPGVTSSDSTDEFTVNILTSTDSVSFYPINVEPKILVYGLPRNIASIKVKESNGVNSYLGKWVFTKGTVTVANEFGGPSYLQDNTSGLSVYDSSISNNVIIGDEISVLGKVSPYYDLFELSPAKYIEKTAEGVIFDTLTLTIPQIVSQNQNGFEPYESRLIRINNIEKVLTTNNTSVSTWAVTGSGTNYNLISGNDTLEVRINSGIDLVNLAIPSGNFDIIGALGQYKTLYQIMPRSYKDIIAEGNGPQIISGSPYETLITTNSITFNYKTNVEGTSIIKFGETTSYGNFVSDENKVVDHEISVSGLAPSTIYHVRIGSANNGDTTYTPDYIVETSSITSSGTMNVYFNYAVDNSVSTGENAQVVNIYQKFVDRINSAESSIDVALYSLSGTVGANIANALIQAKNRGVKIRVIGEYDNRTTAPWTTLTNNGIPLIFDNYDTANAGDGLMHNKFAIFDNSDTSGTNDWIWSGSWNATDPGNNNDAQNVIEIQDKSLANAYRIEFEEMWGSSSDTPNSSVSKFGARKSDNTPHRFNIAGTPVELYFDPSDNTTLHIGDALQSATTSINIAMLTFTRNDLAQILIDKKNDAKKVHVILDNNTDTGSEFSYLQSNDIDVLLKGSAITGLLHHKYAVIDGDNSFADPIVVTGSHNWSSSAETSNNENTLIIHSKPIANLYLQEFTARYYEAGGTDSIKIITSVENESEIPTHFSLLQNYPNPFNPSTKIQFEVPHSQKVELIVFDILGRKVRELYNDIAPTGSVIVEFRADDLASGMYIYRLKTDNFSVSKKMILLK